MPQIGPQGGAVMMAFWCGMAAGLGAEPLNLNLMVVAIVAGTLALLFHGIKE